jgi:hypothetical protein
LEFLQSLNTTDVQNSHIQPNTTQSTVTFDSLFTEEDEDDEEFIGPEDENQMENLDEKKLRVSSIINQKFSSEQKKIYFLFRT